MSLIDVWHAWLGRYDDRINFNLAQRYVQAVERKDRDRAEQLAADIKVPRHKRNQDKLRVCIDLCARRVLGKGEGFSDAAVGGCYRTMSEAEYMGSDQERLAGARYERLNREANGEAR